MKSRLVILIALIILSLGVITWLTTIKKPTNHQSSTPGVPIAQDACDFPLDKSFQSLDKQEVGLGANGQEMGYWHLTFQKDEVNWQHSDILQSGTYSCDKGIITVTFSDSGLIGHYNPTTGLLLFDGHNYKIP